ncbi:MAG: 2-hydroxyacid dehydrogenase [Candidatus Njordarchaeales archaeon]
MFDKNYVLVMFRTIESDRKIIEETIGDLAKVFYLRDLDEDEKAKIIPQVKVIITGSGRDLSRDLIESATSLEMIQTLSAGVDNVPFQIIPENIIVCSNAGGNAQAVAEHALALLFAAVKRVVYHTEKMRKGIWERRKYGILLRGKKLGIIGLGHIGAEIAKMAKALGMKVYGINRSGKTDVPVDFIGTPKDLHKVLSEADIIVISLPLTKYTRGLIGAKELGLMKKNAILINISRGEIIDQRALYEHLRNNPEFIAALDVWWRYPKEEERIYQDYPFHELENVIMTPHIAGFTPEIREQVIRNAMENVARYLRGEKPRNIVNRDDYV